MKTFELFIALRYLLTRRKHSFISAISLISICGVALGVAALIVVLGVMNGFSSNLKDKILGVNAHIMVSSHHQAFAGYQEPQEKIREIEGVKGVMPFIYTEVMLSSPQGAKGAALRGIDLDSAPQVLNLEQQIQRGTLYRLDSEQNAPPGIIVGSNLASRLNLGLEDRVHVLTPSGEPGTAGFQPEIKTFRIAGIFQTGMLEYDSSLAYVSLSTAQDMLGFKSDMAGGLEVSLQDVYQAQEVADAISAKLDPMPIIIQTWKELNETLFAALELEKTAMGVILTMIVLVGSFSIVTTLIMLVMEKRQDIAILMSLGATRENIRRIFMFQGTIIGFLGTVLGFALGLFLSFILSEYQFITLPQEIYYLDHLPIELAPLDLGLIAGAALLLCFLATIYPARQAAGLQPAEVLRYE